MKKFFNVGERVLVVGFRASENQHLNGAETVIKEIIDKEEACRRMELSDFTERGVKNDFFYVLEDINVRVTFHSSFGMIGVRYIDFVAQENLRKIYPKTDESFEEIIASIKSTNQVEA